ncbi:MAG: HNH endonuclease [Actinomycetia bacterium]|nr:HNH endonuclease [Actinomycetes bacterium]
MPLVRGAFEAGLITIDHVRVLGELTQPRFYSHFIDAEAQLVRWAVSMAWHNLAQAIDAWRTAADDSESDLKEEKDQQARRSNGAPGGTDMAMPLVHVRATAECVRSALQKVSDLEPDLVPVDICECECEYEDGTALSYHQLVDHLIDAKIHSVVLSQQGDVLHHGSGKRWFTAAQKTAMAYRDRWCDRGCGLLARQVDADHDVAWEDDQITDIENVVPRCRTTHTQKTAAEAHRRRKRRRERQRDCRQRRIDDKSVPIDDRASPEVFGRLPEVDGRERPMWRPLDLDESSPSRPVLIDIDFANHYFPGEQRIPTLHRYDGVD